MVFNGCENHTLQKHMQRCEVCSSGKTCYHALQVISTSSWSKLHKWSMKQPLFPIVVIKLWIQIWFPNFPDSIQLLFLFNFAF